jgi:hypothetical protein
MTDRSPPFAADEVRMTTLPSRSLRFATVSLLLVAAASCGKSTQLESGAVMLDLSIAAGVPTPDELRISVYDDTGALWSDERVPATGALEPESASHLGTVLLQPGAAQGALRVHARGLAASARVADGMLSIPAGSRGTFALQLDGDVPADGDGDDVPDSIDDCPDVANVDQHGCPGSNDAGDGGAPPDAADDVAGGDDGGGAMDAYDCDASGGCNRLNGTACTDSAQCKSTFCVDGVCCANACIGPCRSCNQPNNDGVCLPYAQGTDPARECSAGTSCNGAGACGPGGSGPKSNGELCSGTSECMSGFCKDGVFCNSACDTPCRTCETGTCTNVTRKPDAPECYGTMTCSAAAKCVVN